MKNEQQNKFLGTVPKKWQLVETFWDCPEISNQNGITLIALIITIIVMLILVGVTVNVALNGGLFSTAKRAASGMQMAQIRERAEVVKATLIAESQSNNSIIVSKTEYKNRLLQEFEESTAVGSKVIVENGKYDIIIKNIDLEIEVVEHSETTEPSALIDLGYTTSNIEEDGKIYAVNTGLSLTRLMDLTKYSELRAKEDAEKGEEVTTDETKKQLFLECCNEFFGEEEPFTGIDEAVLYDINYWWGYGPFETLEEALQDETLQSDLGVTGEIKREQLYYFLLNDLGYYPEVETESMTEQEVINYYYEEEKNNTYANEYYKYTQNLSVYVENDGTQELIIGNVTVGSRPRTIKYVIGKNGRYDFIVKTKDGEEVAREAMQINNIATPNPYVLTKEEAEGIWETDGKGTITKYVGTDTNIVIPIKIGLENITAIGKNAFKDNSNIISINMNDNIKSIGESAFYSCTSLESINIPENIENIKSSTFLWCDKLKEIILPSKLKTIGDNAFNKCGLVNLTIPDTVTTIGQGAFYYCTSLESINIPENIVNIKYATFAGDRNLKEIILPNNLKTIDKRAFFNCTSLENVTIPDTVTTIEEEAFSNCKSLTKIEIPEGVKRLNNAVFSRCSSLETITIPNSVTYIYVSNETVGSYVSAFYGCTNLTTINFAPGDNPIPEGQPWGATNENLVVTKLTE